MRKLLPFAIILFASLARIPASAADAPDTVSVTLPSEIPFRLVLPEHGGAGYVESREFGITNNGTGPVEVTLDDARMSVSDAELFSVSGDAALPEYGNWLYVELVCGDATYPLSESGIRAHTYLLEGGQSASFRLGGAVSERGEAAWSDADVTVTVRFDVTPSEEAAKEQDLSPADEGYGAAEDGVAENPPEDAQAGEPTEQSGNPAEEPAPPEDDVTPEDDAEDDVTPEDDAEDDVTPEAASEETLEAPDETPEAQ